MSDLLKKLCITGDLQKKEFPIYVDDENGGTLLVIVSAKNLDILIDLCNEADVCDDCKGWKKCKKPACCPLRMYAPTIEKCTKRDFGEFRSDLNG